MASNNFPSQAPEKVDVLLRNLDFRTFRGIESVFNVLDKDGKLKVLQKIVATVSLDKFMDLLADHKTVRAFICEHHTNIFPEGVIGKQKIERRIVNNSHMAQSSKKFWSVCSFQPAKVAAFVNDRLKAWGR